MEVVWFSLVAILLYLAADRMLRAIEASLGRNLEYRSVIFFGMLFVMAMVTSTQITHDHRPRYIFSAISLAFEDSAM